MATTATISAIVKQQKQSSYENSLDLAPGFGIGNLNTNENGELINNLKSMSSSSSSSSSSEGSSTSSSASASHSSMGSSNGLFRTLAGSSNSLKNQLEAHQKQKSLINTSTIKSEIICSLCKNRLSEPKLLGCTHVYCKKCLLAHIVTESTTASSLMCPKCKQETLIDDGVECLEDDYIMQNMLDMIAIQENILDCTSCKTEEKAVARCADCAQFLCPNCVSAHQYMRCFENHRVVNFEEIKQTYEKNLLNLESTNQTDDETAQKRLSNESLRRVEHAKIKIDRGVPIHKPLFCKEHEKESLKFFCNTCQVRIILNFYSLLL
jgi:hypothetical protein